VKRLSQLEVEYFKKLTLVNIPIKRGVTEISGDNGAGKSSAIDAVMVWLDGLKVAPPEPIHSGAERCRIRGRLGEMYVIRHIDIGKHGKYTTKIQFQPIDGKPYPATQAQLDDLIGEHCLDPVDFLKLDSKGLFKAFQVFVPGFDFARAALEHKADYDRRTEVNRVAKETRAAASLIIVPAKTPDEPIDEAELVKKLEAAGTENARTVQRRANRQTVAAKVVQLRENATQLQANLATMEANIRQSVADAVADFRRQIAVLEERIEKTNQDANLKMLNDRKYVQDTVAANIKEADELEAQIASAGELPKTIDTAELSKQINDARATNEAVNRKAERAKHISTAEKYEAESDVLTESIKIREAAKRKAIADAKLPIEGLDFVDGEVRLNDQPFEQASMAEKLTLALAYTVKRNPGLRLAWIRDASLLDDKAYARVERLAEEFDCDVLLETVRPIGKNAVVLEDGRVKSLPAEEGAAA
jgi:hypothetical protein